LYQRAIGIPLEAFLQTIVNGIKILENSLEAPPLGEV